MNESTLNRIEDRYLTEENQYQRILKDYYAKKQIDNPEKNTTSDKDLQLAILKVADEMGLDYDGGDLRTKANNAKQKIFKGLKDVVPDSATKPKGTSIETKSGNVSDAPEIPTKAWPKYEQFRKKYYEQTIALGWPRDINEPSLSDNLKENGIVYPWNGLTKSPYPFNKRGKGLVSFRNYTKKIKDYLFTKFENNQEGLKKLLEKVESILDVESQFLKKKKGSMMGTLLINIFKGLGATEGDEAILKWLGAKYQGMTIFEYQKYILEEMFTKMSISETTAKNLKAILFPLHRQVKEKASPYYNVSQVNTEHSFSENEYDAFFTVTTKTQAKKAGQEHAQIYSPFVFVLENTVIPMLKGENYTSKSGRKLTSPVDVDYLNGIIKKLKGSSPADVSKITSSMDDVILNYDAVDEKGKKVGTYKFEFEYAINSCKITVGYIPESSK